MLGWLGKDASEDAGRKLTRIDLAAMSLISLIFGLAIIAKGLIHGG